MLAECYGTRTSLQPCYYHLFILFSVPWVFQASCGYDKIYAALRLAQRSVTSDITASVVPDYSSFREAAFTAFTSLILRQVPISLPLSWVEGRSRSPSLPSWCPDYRCAWYSPLIPLRRGDGVFKMFSASGTVGYCLGLARSPSVQTSDGTDIDHDQQTAPRSKIDKLCQTRASLEIPKLRTPPTHRCDIKPTISIYSTSTTGPFTLTATSRTKKTFTNAMFALVTSPPTIQNVRNSFSSTSCAFSSAATPSTICKLTLPFTAR
jgi:hypothetical protein